MIKKIRKVIKKLENTYEATLAPLFNSLSEHNIYLISAGIAFNILLYFIPIILFTIFIISQFYNIEEITLTIEYFIAQILPPGKETEELIWYIFDEVTLIFESSSLVGWIALITLLWLSSTLFSSVRSGLNRVFGYQTPKIFILYRFKDMILTIGLAIIIVAFSILLPIISIVHAFFSDYLPTEFSQTINSILVEIGTLFIFFILFYLMYFFIPNGKTSNTTILISTIFCVIFTELSRYLFAYYISNLASFGKFYGAYTLIISIFLWIYYLSFIILFSAELTLFLRRRKT